MCVWGGGVQEGSLEATTHPKRTINTHARTHTQGVLAANIFDWGAAACVELYQNGTILEIYRCV